MTTEFTVGKYDGTGNDFLVLLCSAAERDDDLDIANTPFADVSQRAELARRWCDRNTGLLRGADGLTGADGLIFGVHRPVADGLVLMPDKGKRPFARMVLHNADGSPAEVSGNGLCCLTQALFRQRWMNKPGLGGWLTLATAAGEREVHVQPQRATLGAAAADVDDVTKPPTAAIVDVDMGAATEGQPPTNEQLKVIAELGAKEWCSVSVGNPHLVVHVPAERPDGTPNSFVTPERLDEIGAALGRADEPDHAVNVEIIGHVSADGKSPLVVPNLDLTSQTFEPFPPDTLDASQRREDNAFGMLVWERGVGQTDACGTGAVAAAECAVKWGLVSQEAPAHACTLGGHVRVWRERDEDGSPTARRWLTGRTKFVGETTLTLPALAAATGTNRSNS